MKNFLGIDIGTTGVKVLAIDESGKAVASEREEYPLDTPKPGWAEQDPELWWNATARATSRLLSGGALSPSSIAAVGLSGQMHGLVAMDRTDAPLRPAILWCDQRTADECEWLESNFGAELLRVCLNSPLAGFTLPKILWMKNNEPELSRNTAAALLPKDYIRFMLTGEKAIEISDAAGTLMLDISKGEWARELMNEIGVDVDKLLPPVVGSDVVCGRITAPAARATGIPEGTPVAGGGADNACAAIGTGIAGPGLASSSIGSSGVVLAHCDTVIADPQGRTHTFNHAVPGARYIMGVMLAAGLSFRWFRDTFCEAERSREAAGDGDAYYLIARLAAQAPPGCEGLAFLPYLNGERAPHKDPFARGSFTGISLRHNRAHFARAVMEGIVFGLKDSLEIIRSLGAPVSEIRATGGGGKSAFWRQMQADIFRTPVTTLQNDEGPAFGAALLAATSVGAFADVRKAAETTVSISDRTEPDPEKADAYERQYKRYRELYPALKHTYKSI